MNHKKKSSFRAAPPRLLLFGGCCLGRCCKTIGGIRISSNSDTTALKGPCTRTVQRMATIRPAYAHLPGSSMPVEQANKEEHKRFEWSMQGKKAAASGEPLCRTPGVRLTIFTSARDIHNLLALLYLTHSSVTFRDRPACAQPWPQPSRPCACVSQGLYGSGPAVDPSPPDVYGCRLVDPVAPQCCLCRVCG